MQNDATVHLEDEFAVKVVKISDHLFSLRITDSDGCGSGVTIIARELMYLDRIADAIDHFIMDQDADVMQAEQLVACKVCGGIDSQSRGHRVGCTAE